MTFLSVDLLLNRYSSYSDLKVNQEFSKNVFKLTFFEVIKYKSVLSCQFSRVSELDELGTKTAAATWSFFETGNSLENTKAGEEGSNKYTIKNPLINNKNRLSKTYICFHPF